MADQRPESRATPAEFVDIDGERFVCIHDAESFPTFFLTMVSSGDHWLFTATNGSLSAGRGSPETALFPYYTVDKIIDNWNSTGPQTWIQIAEHLWEPFKPHTQRHFSIQRRLYKSINGDVVIFEETNRDLELTFRFRWQSSDKFGFVRQSQLINRGSQSLPLRIVDGISNFMAAGIDSRTQQEYSCLTDAYKLSECDDERKLLVHRMAATLTDEAVPLESLKATTVWSYGWPESHILMREETVEAYLRDGVVDPEKTQRAFRGAFFNAGQMELAAGEVREWAQISDIEQTQSDVAELLQKLDDPANLWREVCSDIASGREKLDNLIAAADGQQVSAEEIVANYHRANVLFNIMRGGVFSNDYTIDVNDLRQHIHRHKRHLNDSETAWLRALPDSMNFPELREKVRTLAESDLIRICSEYLPLTFSRRHGDPSRPWNRFNIRTKDAQGNDIVGFEGNWRDIFQNWEALAWSFPLYNDAFIRKFLNASTADGYNPYRITSDGINWEEPDPDDPWASIGYWGDHQIIYLLKLLEFAEKMDPSSLHSKLNSSGFVFAEVPYEIKAFDQLVRDPNHSIHFNENLNREIQDRVAGEGADGKLLHGEDSKLIKATLLEKLLIPLAVKLSNFVPGGGIWMNTQRPEWNDANNALAGHGLSLVTTSYLHRYLVFLERLLEDQEGPFECREALRIFLGELLQIFTDYSDRACASSEVCYAMTEALGRSGEKYRTCVYRKNLGDYVSVPGEELKDLVRRAGAHLRATITGNRRTDGLYHSYNILQIDPETKTARIETLGPMLEGQVAVLSSEAISDDNALGVIRALRKSPLYCERRNSYILYADKNLPSFLDFNRIDPDDATAIPLLGTMLSESDHSLIEQSKDGCIRFRPHLRNRFELREALKDMANDPSRKEAVENDTSAIEQLYENTFQHRSFTGRSGSMFAYEGLGSIYWHMVSKLMLAVQERALAAVDTPAFHSFVDHYYDIQNGLGFRKTPRSYGAFPADAYSHTPAHAGAQQPGLTGMVKEGIICRFAELGVELHNGLLRFRPRLLRKAELTDRQRLEPLRCAQERSLTVEVPENGLLFTIAQTPVVYVGEAIEQPWIEVHLADGQAMQIESDQLTPALSEEVLNRSGLIDFIKVYLPEECLLA